MLRSFFTPARLIMAIFFLQAVAITNWFPRIPDMQHRLGLGPGGLSICLIGSSIGGFVVTFFTGSLIHRISARRAMLWGMVAYYAAQILPGWAWNGPSLFAALFLMGATFVTVDVASNVEAARIQDALGHRIMSTCHGFWSTGSMVGALVGGAFAEGVVDTRLHLLIVGLVCLPIALLLVGALPQALEDRSPDVAEPPVFAVPSVGMLGLCVFAFGAIIGELTTRNWAAVFLRETMGTSAAATGWGLGVFSAFMAIGRFAGDRLADLLGPAALGRVCAGLAVAGLIALVTANGLPLALVGFAALGLGVSVGYPLSVSAAAARGDRPAALNVASLSLIAYTGALVGPPLVGFVAEVAGMRIGLAAILPLLALGGLFAGELKRPRRQAAAPATGIETPKRS
jgi:MFS family permease